MIDTQSHRRVVALAASLMLIAGCGSEPDLNAEPVAAQIARGEAVYEEVCSECHSLQPPPNLAPPFTHVGRMVKSKVEDREAFTRHVVTYVQSPSPERSLLPAHAIERFGIMQAPPLPEDRLRDVAAYMWVMADSAAEMDHEGEMGEGMGGMDHEGGMGGGMGGMGGGMGMGRAADTVPPGDTIR